MNFFFFYVTKIAIWLSLSLFKPDVQAAGEAFSPQKRTSSPPKMKFIHFFLFMWVIFVLLDPDLDCESRSGSTTLAIAGIRYSNEALDCKHRAREKYNIARPPPAAPRNFRSQFRTIRSTTVTRSREFRPQNTDIVCGHQI